MKKLLLTVLCLIFILPLYAQETEPADITDEITWDAQDETTWDTQDETTWDTQEEDIEDQGEQTNTPSTFNRQNFEIGFDIGAGFDNDLLKIGEILQKDLVIDLEVWRKNIGDTGLNLNLDLLAGLHVNVINVNIGGGVWDFGLFTGADGNLNFNLPKNLFTLLGEGNIRQRYFSGIISASGGVYANVGLSASAKYGKLRLGARPSIFSPLLVIPKSGINYILDTNGKIELTSSGEVSIYGIAADIMENRDVKISTGFDISIEGEYELFTFLDVGGSISRIPIVPAAMRGRMFARLEDVDFNVTVDELLEGEGLNFPEIEYNTGYDESASRNLLRPLRFDIFARYKPFGDLLIVKPNIGFSVSFNDEQGFFNIGAEAQVNLFNDMLSFHLGTGLDEAVWKHRLGFAFNVRAFELDLEGALRSQSFAGSFSGQGFGLNLGLRFGW